MTTYRLSPKSAVLKEYLKDDGFCPYCYLQPWESWIDKKGVEQPYGFEYNLSKHSGPNDNQVECPRCHGRWIECFEMTNIILMEESTEPIHIVEWPTCNFDWENKECEHLAEIYCGEMEKFICNDHMGVYKSALLHESLETIELSEWLQAEAKKIILPEKLPVKDESKLVEGIRVKAECPECGDLQNSLKSLKEPGRAICVGCRCSYNIWYPYFVAYCSRCKIHRTINTNIICDSCFNFDKKDCQPGEPLVEKGE